MATIRKTYKYRIYPTKAQQTRLENIFSMCRHLYNWSLQERKEAYEQEGRSLSWYEQKRKLPELKRERPWFKGVHSQVLQDVLQRLDEAYQNFFRRVKSGETSGYPKFKKRGQWHSITYPQYTKRPSETIRVSKVGAIKVVMHREILEEADIKTLTIRKEGGKWFACFSVELTLKPEPESDKEPKQDLPPVAIDLGLIDYIYASNGFHCTYPKALRKSLKRLKRLQRRFSKAKKRSKQWYRLLKALRKTHYRIACQRLDFLHKTANTVLEFTDCLIHEDLNIRNMLRRPKPKQDENGKYLPNRAAQKAGLNLSISDAAWGTFLKIVSYKAAWRKKRTLPVSPKNSSQECLCGEAVKKRLSDRVHDCPNCGLVDNRDFVSSHVLLRRGLATLAASAA